LKSSIIYHEKFCQYDLGLGFNHPFRGRRFAEARHFLKEKGLDELSDVSFITPEMATWEDLVKVHAKSYIDLIFHLAEENAPYDLETPVSAGILEALMYIIGGAVEAGTSICEGRVNRAVNLGGGFHHAGRNYGGGFCIFNDVAILSENLRQKHQLKRILVLDFDVHFGNGTSDIFYSDPGVLYVSLHQDPRTIFPWTGFIEQVGNGEGEGYNVNVPLPPGTGEATYLLALKEIFVPLAEEFKPEIVIASGGSDAYFADLLGRLGLTIDGFFELARIVREESEKICGGRSVLLLGSGYNPEILPSCWYALTMGFLGSTEIDAHDSHPPPYDHWARREEVENVLKELKKILSKYWKCF